MTGLVSLVLGLVGGAGVLIVFQRVTGENKIKASEEEAGKILNRAKGQAAKIDREAKGKAKDFESRARRNVEGDIKKQKQKLESAEQKLKEKEGRLEGDFKKKEDTLQQKLNSLEQRSDRIKIAEVRIQELEQKAEQEIQGLKNKLESVANMTADQARDELRKAMEEEVRQNLAGELQSIEDEMRAKADRNAKRILSVAVSRFAGEMAAERTVATVPLTSDEMKGKIIGREGRNIRALEAACGVDLIIDETPEAVVISSFDAVRREVARQALLKLMEDGRVHPARIEEVVDKVKSELFASIKEEGEKACFDLGVHGVHPSVMNLLGSLKYRHSETQNLLKHSVEVATLAGMMAAEIGYDEKLARRAGLLHDIGKAIDHTVDGSHALVGAEYAKRHGEKDPVCHAIRAHHDEEKPETILAHLVQAANNLSKARPGARRGMMENYIRRLEDLESIGNSFDGVSRTFAIQSGKEIRVLVDSSKVTDEQSIMLSRDIARKIERELNYPGQVKVTVVRETRMVEHAR
ncbi:MAG: ribonuclease Y [Bdellovibrionaceae bacterium]|nr:ribonuclease Y [Bdellovibrionales bacterium]MCB9084369.1 ribonuclease Y [Pseudobdellovibrionaceae bacterium]